MNEVEKPTRMYFIDNLRILLTILVIMHHTMIAYGASGDWYFKDPVASRDITTIIILSLIAGLDQAFFMGFFFLISTYFITSSYNRKGAKNFLKDRFIRLGIPIVIYVIIVNPILEYITSPTQNISFFEFYLAYFQSLEKFLVYIGSNGPLWFILTILIFALIYCLYRAIFDEDTNAPVKPKPLTNSQIIIIIIIMSVLTFLVRAWYPIGFVLFNMQINNFVQYIIMLILGIVAYKRGWFRSLSETQGKLWLRIALLSIPILIIFSVVGGVFDYGFDLLLYGFTWQQFAYATWESIFCLGMCIGLIVKFRDKFNEQGTISKTVTENVYTMYLIHAPVVVGISLLFVIIFIPALLKFVIVLSIVLLLCFLISHFILRRIPGTKRVLG